MSRDYNDNYTNSNGSTMRQKDLVLSSNEFCLLRNNTSGAIKTYTGPIMLTISQQESLVVLNSKTKRFEETQDFEKARQLFVSAPEGWYVVLKNPAPDNSHPEAGKAVSSPDLLVGHKINVPGPTSFSLYPGQMSRVIRGHRLRSNQYLLARVYDADAANKNASTATMIDAEGNEVKTQKNDYFVGQLLIIRGTDVSFYIPPTGIEVIPVDSKNGEGAGSYVRDAVTLERLEYVILKDESGEKRYVSGPAVVFPKPTETFTMANNGKPIFRALELSPISGIYVKVIAAYDDKDKDGKKIHHPVGEELFITGKDQMIYYPRPEHALIQYDGRYMHHAIAIPEGEGRYILDRLSGKIKTVKGPDMYLPDPRYEVVVKRKLSDKECGLFYPGNIEVLEYNRGLSEKAMEKLARKGMTNSALDTVYSTANSTDSLAIFEATSNISRGVSYTKPRTITLDTKYDGVVSVDVWTGYAVNIVSKSGKREVLVGPTTRLLDYDETLEALELSTGKPKTTDELLRTAFLRVENNKISDIINAQTSDYVDVQIKVSYCVDFLEEYKDKWFSIENYVKFLCDRVRSLLKREVKKHDIQDFYANSTDIVRKIVLNIDETVEKVETVETKPTGRLFKDNGMFVKDVEVLSVAVERRIAEVLDAHQDEMIKKTLQLSDAAARLKVAKELAKTEKEEIDLKHQNEIYAIERKQEEKLQKLKNDFTIREKERAEEEARQKAEADLQPIYDSIAKANLDRTKAKQENEIAYANKQLEIENAKKKAYAEMVASIMESISDDLVAAMSASSNEHMLSAVTQAMAPYAIAKSESVADVTNTLLRGTSLEKIIDNVKAVD